MWGGVGEYMKSSFLLLLLLVTKMKNPRLLSCRTDFIQLIGFSYIFFLFFSFFSFSFGERKGG